MKAVAMREAVAANDLQSRFSTDPGMQIDSAEDNGAKQLAVNSLILEPGANVTVLRFRV
jgi:hypothetical protein